jgi:hypothetical protein
MAEAPLEDNGSGLAPGGARWFVVNVRDAQWLTTEEGEKQRTGSECYFETGKAEFPQLGFRIHVCRRASRMGSTTARTSRRTSSSSTANASCSSSVKRGDSAPGTSFIARRGRSTSSSAGDEPCVVVMAGARGAD